MQSKTNPLFQQQLPYTDSDGQLLHQVLSPYRAKSCEYLKSASLKKNSNRLIGYGQFAIDESCYIDDTGHFNSVEFNICYNQLFYYMVAKSIKEGLTTEFSNWTLDDYWQKQLSDILITHLSSKFRRELNACCFNGKLEFIKLSQRKQNNRSTLFLKTIIQFWDNNNGYSEGEVKVAIIHSDVTRLETS